MADIRIRNAFGFPIAWLEVYCSRFDRALDDETVGPEVRRHLPSDLPDRFKAQRARLDELAVLQAAAHGRAGELTVAKHDALGDVVLLSGSARRAARGAYVRDPALLHGEFFVGGDRSKSVATILANAEKLVENCRSRAEALAPHGWSAEETTFLAAAVDALRQADTAREAATDVKEGYTAEQTAVANELYQMCRAIQNVARVIYPKSKIAPDGAIVRGRASFMLGEFPPRPGTKSAPVADDSAGAIPVEPAPIAPGSPTAPGAESIGVAPLPGSVEPFGGPPADFSNSDDSPAAVGAQSCCGRLTNERRAQQDCALRGNDPAQNIGASPALSPPNGLDDARPPSSGHSTTGPRG